MKLLPAYLKCIVCGRENHRGLKMRFSLDGDVIRSEVPFTDEFCSFKDVVHGGILTAVLDEAMGWAASHGSRRMCQAAELRIRFVKPVQAGDKVQVVARLDRDRKRVIEASGELLYPDGTVLVKGSGKFMPLDADQARFVDSYLDYEDCERIHFVY